MNAPLHFIDKYLNRITMYRLVLYYLVVLLIAAAIFGLFGVIPYDPATIIFSTALITGVCWVTNKLFARVYSVAENVESIYITAFILALIISPVASNDVLGVGFIVFTSAWAMAAKYIFAIKKKHLFNPAAFAVALSALTLNQSATWWVGGNLWLFPFVLVGGFLVVRKIQRFDMVASFSAVALVTIAATSLTGDYATALMHALLHSSFFFLAFVMLTEPLTSPPDKTMRMIYGALVGALFAPALHIGSLYSTPELALLVGNIFAYIVSPKERLVLTLKAVEKIGTDTYDFVFSPDQPLHFRAGQYLEWTLGHASPDTRGNRRYFTIASSPTEMDIRMGVKFYPESSSFKRALAAMKPGDRIFASQLAGSFTLPKNPAQKLVFIAGGIGITPYRSIIQYMIDRKDTRPVVLLYSNKKTEDIAYRNVFDRAQHELGIKTVYLVTSQQTAEPGIHMGSLDAELIKREIPDYHERMFYISGPHGMVTAFEKTLRDMGIPRRMIKIDFFPGFV